MPLSVVQRLLALFGRGGYYLAGATLRLGGDAENASKKLMEGFHKSLNSYMLYSEMGMLYLLAHQNVRARP